MGQVRIQLGPWTPDLGELENPGLLAVRSWTPWKSGTYRPMGYFVLGNPTPQADIGGDVRGMHIHSWVGQHEVYTAVVNGASSAVKKQPLTPGNPATGTPGIGAVTDLTASSPWGAFTMPALGCRFASVGKNVVLAGDETFDPLYRDGTGSTAFGNLFASGAVPGPGSEDRPMPRYVAVCGQRLLLAYIQHGSAGERDRVGSPDLINPDLCWFTGKNDITYISTRQSTAGGINDWDQGKISEHFFMYDDLGEITGLASLDEGYVFIFKRRGVYRLDWTSTTGPEPVLMSREVGTLAPHSLVAVGPYVYFYDSMGGFSRVSQGGVERVSGPVESVLLDEDLVDLGTYVSSDPDNAGEDWVAAMDIATLHGGGAYPWPVGAWDAYSRTVRWVYPSLKTSPQRWMEVVHSVDSGGWAAQDMTHAQDKPNSERRVDMHWVAGLPGLGHKWAPSTTQRYSQSPRDVLYAFRTGDGPPVTYSLTYFWPSGEGASGFGYLLLDEGYFATSYQELGGRTRVTGVRPVYSRRQEAEDSSLHVKMHITVRSKVSSYDSPVSSDTVVVDPSLTTEISPDGFWSIPGLEGTYHSLTVQFVADDFDVDLPSSIASVVEEFEGFDLLFTEPAAS